MILWKTRLQLSRRPEQISYETPRDVTRGVLITRFDDGGVTVSVWPNPLPSVKREILGVFIGLLVGSLGPCVGMWLSGMRSTNYAAFHYQLLHPTHSALPAMLMAAVPILLWLSVIVIRRMVPRPPVVVGISPTLVYLHNPGLLERRFTVPRRALREIRIGRAKRTSTKHPIHIVLKIDGHLPVILFSRRRPELIDEVANALWQAQRDTSTGKT